jgi:putative two-component system hydrogenase maturation factor HypX/HoxX
MRPATKSSLYRNEVTEAAVAAMLEALERRDPQPAPPGIWRPLMKQADRAIDWSCDTTETVLRKIRSADGNPGLLDQIDGRPVYLFDAWDAAERSGPGLVRKTADGAVWVGHLRWKEPDAVKLPAAMALTPSSVIPADLRDDIRVERDGSAAYLHFPFHNGAMSTDQCQALLAAYQEAIAAGPKVLVLMGGPDFWCNGIHLNTIEAADSPADESWRNINAMDDLTRAIITTTGSYVVSAMQGNGGAGGVFLALAADEVWARDGVVLNPHYKGMGNLYGSEYWTYLLPRRAGTDNARRVTQARLPIGTAEAQRLGLIDAHFGSDSTSFVAEARRRAAALAADPALPARLAEKAARRAADEALKPLDAYRREELEKMTLNFYGFDPSYHVARYNFVRKVPKSRTPLYLARHRASATPA